MKTIILFLLLAVTVNAQRIIHGNGTGLWDGIPVTLSNGCYVTATGSNVWCAPVVVTNVIDRLTVPEKAERYIAAWDLAATAQSYGATNTTKLANLYVMDAAVGAATNDTQRLVIQRDAVRMSEIENNLARYGGWTEWLNRYETNIVEQAREP